jgi:hypothetical protein
MVNTGASHARSPAAMAPEGAADKISWPASVRLVSVTVRLARSVPSGSVTVAAAATRTGPETSSTKAAANGPPPIVGGSSVAVTLTVDIAAALGALPSSTTRDRDRSGASDGASPVCS